MGVACLRAHAPNRAFIEHLFVYNEMITKRKKCLCVLKGHVIVEACTRHKGKEKTMSKENWATAKKELSKLGIAINTRVKSCELGCACVGDPWSDENRGKPQAWQTGKRFSPKWGGQLNHANLTDAHKWQIMATLNANGISWEWDGESHHTIGIDLEANA